MDTTYNITEKKNERISLAITITAHCVLLVLILFLGAFKAPNPPLGSGDPGVELNFGLDDAGSGNIQTEAPANNNTSVEDAKPGDKINEIIENQQQSQEEVTEALEEAPVVEDKQNIVTSEEESPVAINEEKKKELEVKPKEEIKPKETEKKEEPKKEEPKINTNALYKKPGANGKSGEGNQTPGNNNGDRPGAVGDQGNPNGSLDAKALYGKPGNGGTGGGGNGGSGGGPTLNLPGWTWDNKPDKKDPSSETGYVIFEFTVDENGEIVPPVRRVAGNLSPTVEKFYRQQLETVTFSPINSKIRTTSSKGTVRFDVTAR